MNNTKHTARYQLSRFLQSQESFNLSLDGKDIAILMIIFDFMDSGDEEKCFAKQSLISKISRVARRTLIDRIKKLISFNLIIKKRVGYKNYYSIGETIKKYVLLPHIVSAATAHSKCGSGTLYNNNYKNIYNIGSSNIESQSTSASQIKSHRQDNPSPLLQEKIKKVSN